MIKVGPEIEFFWGRVTKKPKSGPTLEPRCNVPRLRVMRGIPYNHQLPALPRLITSPRITQAIWWCQMEKSILMVLIEQGVLS
jgi:hypothetical protein